MRHASTKALSRAVSDRERGRAVQLLERVDLLAVIVLLLYVSILLKVSVTIAIAFDGSPRRSLLFTAS